MRREAKVGMAWGGGGGEHLSAPKKRPSCQSWRGAVRSGPWEQRLHHRRVLQAVDVRHGEDDGDRLGLVVVRPVPE